MEIREKPSLRLLDETLYSILQAEPFELARHQLVTRHDGIRLLDPRSRQRTPAGLFRFKSFIEAQIYNIKNN